VTDSGDRFRNKARTFFVGSGPSRKAMGQYGIFWSPQNINSKALQPHSKKSVGDLYSGSLVSVYLYKLGGECTSRRQVLEGNYQSSSINSRQMVGQTRGSTIGCSSGYSLPVPRGRGREIQNLHRPSAARPQSVSKKRLVLSVN
jgi:hypothetical protein